MFSLTSIAMYFVTLYSIGLFVYYTIPGLHKPQNRCIEAEELLAKQEEAEARKERKLARAAAKEKRAAAKAEAEAKAIEQKRLEDIEGSKTSQAPEYVARPKLIRSASWAVLQLVHRKDNETKKPKSKSLPNIRAEESSTTPSVSGKRSPLKGFKRMIPSRKPTVVAVAA